MDENKLMQLSMRTPEQVKADVDFISKVISRLTQENKILTDQLVRANESIADLSTELDCALNRIESLIEIAGGE